MLARHSLAADQVEFAQLLIKEGASTTAKNHLKQTPFDLASPGMHFPPRIFLPSPCLCILVCVVCVCVCVCVCVRVRVRAAA